MILISIDGTGPFSDEAYDTAMRGSFCGQIANQTRGSSSYYRGPWAITAVTILRVWGGVAEIIRSGERKVFLVGYSRGGAAVIEVAHYLRDMAVEVEAMFLFDPVKREGGLPNATVIPRNVKNCYKILRTLAGSKGILDSLDKWDPVDIAPDPYQRRWMGNCGNTFESSGTHLEQAVVDGSHGAAGGAPWPSHKADKVATDTAAKWMTAQLNRHGLPVTLKSYWDALNKTENLGKPRLSNRVMGIKG